VNRKMNRKQRKKRAKKTRQQMRKAAIKDLLYRAAQLTREMGIK